MAFGTKHKRKRTIATLVGGAVAGMAGVGTAMAGTYIVPTDIDQYKQKTDQVFFDTYKNPNSTHGKLKKKLWNNSEVRKLQAIGTPNVITANNPLVKKSADASAGGISVADGTRIELNINNSKYSITYTSDGVRIQKVYGKGVARGNIIAFEGDSAIQKGKTRCVSRGKYGCTLRERTAVETYVNVISGEITQNVVKQRRNYNCSKYGCSATSNWYDVALVKSTQTGLDIAKAALTGRGVGINSNGVYVGASVDVSDPTALQTGGKYGYTYNAYYDYRHYANYIYSNGKY